MKLNKALKYGFVKFLTHFEYSIKDSDRKSDFDLVVIELSDESIEKKVFFLLDVWLAVVLEINEFEVDKDSFKEPQDAWSPVSPRQVSSF